MHAMNPKARLRIKMSGRGCSRGSDLGMCANHDSAAELANVYFEAGAASEACVK